MKNSSKQSKKRDQMKFKIIYENNIYKLKNNTKENLMNEKSLMKDGFKQYIS
jgi:hypothetical protein